MTTYTLFGQSAETVSGTGTAGPGTVGLHFTANSACSLQGLWLYSPSGHSLTALPTEILVYNYSTQAVVASNTSPSWSGAAGSGWVYAAFTSAVSLASGTGYMAAAYQSAATVDWFIYNSASWSAAITSGPVTGPVNDGGQGWYNASSLGFPGSQLANWNWFLDIQVSVAAAGPQSPYTSLIPPGLASPMAFQRQQRPSPAPVLASSADTGAGADSGADTVPVSGADAGSAADTAAAGLRPGTGLPGTPPGLSSPMAFRNKAYPSAAPVAAAPPPATGTVSASAQPGRAQPGGAQPGNPGSTVTPPAPSAPQAPYTLLVPPGLTSPMAFQRHAFPSPAPVLAQSADTGTGADTGTVTADVSDSDTGSGADGSVTGVPGSDTGSGSDTGGIPGPSFPLTPPGLSSPAAFRFQRWPSGAPPQVPSPDTGTGADSGIVTASVSDSDAGTGADTASLTADVSDTDTGAGADSAAVTASITDTDTGSGTDAASVTVTGAPPPPTSAVLIPPAPFTPMTFRRQAFPSSAPVLTPAQDIGSGGDSSQLKATDTDAGSGADTAQPTVTGTDTGTGADSATTGISDTDAGSAADAATVGTSGADTGSGAESSLQGPAVRAFPLIPPGRSSPMALGWQAFPTGAPPEVASQDAGAGADGSTLAVTDSDTGSGADTAAVTVSGTDSGSGSDTAAAGVLPGTGLPGTPPGFASPMAFRFQSWPTAAPAPQAPPGADTGTASESAAVTVSDTDVGTGTEGAAHGVPVTGAGTVWWLNPVRESMTGLDVSLHMSTALGAILQFASTGNERLYVMAAGPGITLTVTDGGMVLDQAAQPFPPVALEAGMLYAFGPFHSVVQVPGTSTIQVALSTTYGVQVLVVQGPDAH